MNSVEEAIIMHGMKVLILMSITLMLITSLYSISYANPIPIPTIIMPKEYINITLKEIDGRYYANVTGVYPFENKGYKSIEMYYPIPNNSHIMVWMDGKPLKWEYTNKTYPTVIGDYIMIKWVIENPPDEFKIKVEYTHELYTHNGTIEFLYALGTGKYLEYYAKQTIAYINISSTYSVDTYKVYFDTELNKTVTLNGKPIMDRLIVKSGMFRPLTKDLLLTIKPTLLNNSIVFKTDRKAYLQNEPVELILVNKMDSLIYLPNSAPWGIKDSRGYTVYTPIALQKITEVKPGEARIWYWDQRDYNGKPVKPGLYYAYIEIYKPRATIYASFEIKTPEYPVNISRVEGELYIKVYPDKVRLDYKAFIEPTQATSLHIDNIFFSYNVTRNDNVSKIPFTVNTKLDPRECGKLPINWVHAYYNYQNQSGHGVVKASFRPSMELPLNNISIYLSNVYSEALNATDIDINFSIYLSLSHLSMERISEIEMLVSMINTPSFQEKINNTLYEKSGGALELRYIKGLAFNSESGLLNGSIGLRIYRIYRVNMTMIPIDMGEFKSGFASINTPLLRLLSNITSYTRLKTLNVTLDYDSKACVFNLTGYLKIEGDLNKYVNSIKNTIIILYLRHYNPEIAPILQNITDLYIDIHSSYAMIKYPVNGKILISLGGIYLTYTPDPSKTYDVIKNILGSYRYSMPENFKIILVGGSNSKLEVSIHYENLGNLKKLTFTRSNITNIPEVSFIVNPNRYGVADYTLISKNISINGKMIKLDIATNSTIDDVKSIENGVEVKVSGLKGSIGALNMTIPKPEGISKEDVKVYIDGREANATISEADGMLNIYVVYRHSTHIITVKWSKPSNYLAYYIAAAIVILAAIILLYKKI